MKTSLLLLTILLLAPSLRAQTPLTPPIASDPATLFNQAALAYDNNQWDQARLAYQQILQLGYYSPELFFNLGNLYFKQGKLGPAILYYQRARLLQPRDTEINANLRFAQEHAGAVVPTPSPISALLLTLNRAEWARLLQLQYLLLALLAVLYPWLPTLQPILKRMLITLSITTLISFAGWYTCRSLYLRPQMVILHDGVKALYAPLPNSTPYFDLPTGSTVRLVEHNASWYKVKHGQQIGWIPVQSGEKIFPWTTPQ